MNLAAILSADSDTFLEFFEEAAECIHTQGRLELARSGPAALSSANIVIQITHDRCPDILYPSSDGDVNITSVGGLVVKSVVAIDRPRVRFPADAFFCRFIGLHLTGDYIHFVQSHTKCLHPPFSKLLSFSACVYHSMQYFWYSSHGYPT